MDKVLENELSYSHGISLIERKNVNISGVKKIESFDDKEFVIITSLGILNVKGMDLELVKLDTYQGLVNIKGSISEISYLDDIKNKKEDGFLAKLFK